MKRKNALFLTNFSEPCFQAIPAVAEYTDREDSHLTLLHVYPSSRSEDKARKAMRSFFAEADRYSRWERVLVPGDPRDAILDYCRQTRPDIVFAPASHPPGIPRFRHRSLRAALLRKAGVSLWTRGRGGRPIGARRNPEHVAYVISGQPDWQEEAIGAAEMALAHRARLHLIHLTPYQQIHDGTLASDIAQGPPSVPIDELARLVGELPLAPVIHSSSGDEIRELPRLLRESGATTVFAGESHVLKPGLFGVGFNRDIEKLDCDVFCFPRRPFAKRAEAMEFANVGYTLLPGGLR